MVEINEKTIAAISTAQAPGAVGIVRISGCEAKKIASKIFFPKGKKKIETAPGYTALFGHVKNFDGEIIDEALAFIFTAPKSYTGEDVIEISCHGGMFVMQKILSLVIKAGAVPAQAGEFTKRAFLNGKMDLTKAESIMQLISAQGEDAAKAAIAGTDGVLERKITKIKNVLVSAAAHLSAWADYPEDEVPEITTDELETAFFEAENLFENLLKGFDSGKILREGVKTAIVGRPNVGKSTIMNLLSGYERSIVTEYAGTTRDVVEDVILLGGIPLYLADTAGIHETDDPVESIGVDKAIERIKTAQLVLAVFDSSNPLNDEDFSIIEKIGDVPCVAIMNKNDLASSFDDEKIKNKFKYIVSISAKEGEGMNLLEDAVKEILIDKSINPSEGILFTERQRDVISRAKDCLDEAKYALMSGLTFDAITVSLEGCIQSLLEFTGERVSETVLDEVFSKFCVGK